MENYDYRKGFKKRVRLNIRRKKIKNIQNWHTKRLQNNTSDLQEASTSVENNESNILCPPQPTVSTSSENIQSCRKRLFGSRTSDFTTENELEEEIFPILDHRTNKESTSYNVDGRRIVDFQFFFNSIKKINNHNVTMGCSIDNLDIIRETRSGLKSEFTLHCNMCNVLLKLSSENYEEKVDINKSAVAGIMNIGSGFTHLESFLSCLDIPPMNAKCDRKVHDTICTAWEKTAEQAMKEAAEEEKEIAVRKGNVDKNGIPLVRVVCDGSWAKRSYKTNYSSLSGVGAIVGYNTRKVLYIGVKNKYCLVCARAESAAQNIPKHNCFKNWTGSSTAMEAAAITEGFLRSEEMYGIKYHEMIADGDSSCYRKILEAKPYQNLVVRKIECRNHLLRNMCHKLKEISTLTRLGPASLRKIVSANILKCRIAVRKATQYWKEKNVPENTKISELRKDILNVASHVFVEHKDCKSRQYFCAKDSPDETNIVQELQKYAMFDNITNVFQYLAQHCKSLILDVDSNYVEQFNSIICKFIGGKRVNYTSRQSYQARCSAAVVSSNTRTPFYKVYKQLAGHSPGKYAKNTELKKLKRHKPEKKHNYLHKKVPSERKNHHYGQYCEKPDMTKENYEIAEKTFLESLATTKERREDVEYNTRSQKDCDEWFHEREKLLTSSCFGWVCRRRPQTSCQNLVKRILYTSVRSKATFWGQIKEATVKEELKEKYGYNIKNCGLIIDPDLPYLGSSPDGLLGLDGLIEIKCPYSARMMTPEEGIDKGKIKFWSFKNDEYIVNKKHYWYYQIQGQLHITRRNYCLLVVWTPLGIKFEKIMRNDIFWNEEMEKKLTMFYKHCLLPELVDPRFKRGMPIRDPAYIIEQQKIKK